MGVTVEKFNYQTIRTFPYTVFAILVTTLFVMASYALYSVLLVNGEISFYQVTNGAYIVCYFVRYLSIVACFVCLYKMADLSKWINLACVMCESYMLAELASRLSKWLANVLPGKIEISIVALFINIFPSLFVMMVIVFIINGVNDLYKKMGKEKKGKSFKKIKPYWVVAALSQMMVGALITPVIYTLSDTRGYLPAGLLVILLVIFYVLVALVIYFKIKSFCYEYYMYNYNKGR